MTQNRLYATLVTLIGILFLLAASATPVAACHPNCMSPVDDDLDEVSDEDDDTATAVFTIYSDTYEDLFGHTD